MGRWIRPSFRHHLCGLRNSNQVSQRIIHVVVQIDLSHGFCKQAISCLGRLISFLWPLSIHCLCKGLPFTDGLVGMLVLCCGAFCSFETIFQMPDLVSAYVVQICPGIWDGW